MAAGWISLVVVWCLYSGVHGGRTVTTTEDPVGLLGDNEVELVCTYSLVSTDIFRSISWKRETSNDCGTYEQMAKFYRPSTQQKPPVLTNLTNPTVFGRVVLTNPTASSLKAKMKFTSVVCGDERKYQCVLIVFRYSTRWYSTRSQSITSFTVKANPKVTTFKEVAVSPSANVEEGQTVTFTCTGNVGRPAGTFLWTRYKGTINTGGTTIDSTTQTSPSTDCTFTGSSRISITTTKDDNDIIVKCALQHSTITDPTDTAYFKITDPINVYYQVRAPNITKSPNAAVHYEDTTLTLTCAAEGNPAPTYVWWVNGTQVGTEAQLQLTDINIAQSGDYVCEATNNFNGNTYNLNSTVRIVIDQVRAPTITKCPKEAVHYEDTNLTLTCAAEGYPAPTYVWWANGTQVGTEAQLQLTDIKIAQSGDYVCEATNNFNGNTFNLKSTVRITIESTRLYTAGAVMLCISVALLIVTLVLGIFISRNKGLPCLTIAKKEESHTFQEMHQSVSAVRDEDERSQYQQLDSANVALPSVYQALGQPTKDEDGRIYSNDDSTRTTSIPCLYDEIHGTAGDHTKSYVNIAFTGSTATGGK